MGKLSFRVNGKLSIRKFLAFRIGDFPTAPVPKNNLKKLMPTKNTATCDATGSMVKRALALVNGEPRGLIAVHQITGVPFYWLQKFSAGKIPKPNANRVQTVVEKLSGKKIKLP